MKSKLLLIILFFSVSITFGQKYFKPVPGGLENVNTGKDYYLVEIKDKDSLAIYNALHTMVKDIFNGVDDEILEVKKGHYIKARGEIKKNVCKTYDILFDVEFKIKNGRYIFSFPKFNIQDDENGVIQQIELMKGSNIGTKGTNRIFMFNRKGKVNINKWCYNGIIDNVDFLGKLFDISDDYKKWSSKKAENEKW